MVFIPFIHMREAFSIIHVAEIILHLCLCLYSAQVSMPTGWIYVVRIHIQLTLPHYVQICLTTTVFCRKYKTGTVQTRNNRGAGGWDWRKKRELAERYRTGAMWLESVSSSALHQLQYTRSDDAWKSIYATCREGRPRREKRERDTKDGCKGQMYLYWLWLGQTQMVPLRKSDFTVSVKSSLVGFSIVRSIWDTLRLSH